MQNLCLNPLNINLVCNKYINLLHPRRDHYNYLLNSVHHTLYLVMDNNYSWSKIAVWCNCIFNTLFWKSYRFPWQTLDVLVKNLKHFLYEKCIKLFCNVPKEKYLAPLRTLYPFIKTFVNPFVDIAWTFFNSSFDSNSTSTCFVSFVLILVLKLNN